MTAPRVSVLLTTFNGAPLLAETLDSVLAQRFEDFELVVVDDCSTDPATPAMLADYAARDRRIRLLRPERNLGIVGARNFGFAACRGTYVAAHDHDDLSHPDRLGLQSAYLDAHPEVAFVGCSVTVLRTDGRREQMADRQTTDPLALRWLLHVDNPFSWASIMLRRAAVERLDAFLLPAFEYADDFEVYHRLLRVGDPASLPEILTTYRWHAGNTSHEVSALLDARAARVLEAPYAAWLGEAAPAAARLAIRHISGRAAPDTATLARLGGYLETILEGFCATHAPAPEARRRVEAQAAGLWWRLTRASLRSGHPRALGVFLGRTALRRGPKPSLADLVASGGIGLLRSLWR